MKLTKLFWDSGRWSLGDNYGNMRVSADNWFGMMSHADKFEAVNSFHSALQTSEASPSLTSKYLLNESQNAIENYLYRTCSSAINFLTVSFSRCGPKHLDY